MLSQSSQEFIKTTILPPTIEGKLSESRSGLSYLGTTLDIRPNTLQDEISEHYQERYDLAKVAQAILYRHGKERQESIVNCCNHPAPLAFPKIKYDATQNKASVINLEKCNSDSCPICAGRKANEHREKMVVWLAEAQKQGLYPLMVTLTTQHNAKESLETVALNFQKAYDLMFSGGWWNRTKDEYCLGDKVVFMESPIGANGWHVHGHIAILSEFEFVLGTEFLQKLTDHISKRWQAVLRKAGRFASWERGVNIVPGESELVNYVTKYGRPPKDDNTAWGVESEATQGHIKTSKLKGLAPFELLAVAGGLSSSALSRFCEIFGYSDDDRANKPTMIEAHAMSLYEEYYYYWKGRSRVRWGYIAARWNLEELVEEYRAAKEAEKVSYEFCLIENFYDLWKRNQLARLRAIIEEKQGKVYEILDECKKWGIRISIYPEAMERSLNVHL